MSMNFHLKCFHISRDTSEIVLHAIKQCKHFITTEIGFRRSWRLAQVCRGMEKQIFIDPQKTKVNQKTYIDFLKTFLLPECRHLYPNNDFVFLQGSTPSHLAKATPNFLRDKTPDFISLQEWTPHSPDLNPLDYSVWDILQELVNKKGVNHLRISKIFRMLSETNGTMSMTRQSEKLYCSGKGI